MQESDLYLPVKNHLENLGYEVKGEVRGCDLMAMGGDDDVVIVELKLSFSLDLVLQGVNRKNLEDNVYMAFPAPDTPAKKRNWNGRRRDVLKLCKMLGLGLITVHLLREDKKVEVLADPAPYQPRINQRKQTALRKEFIQRSGDPNTGGITRRKIVTAYRQDALKCAYALKGVECLKLSELRKVTDVEKAGSILQKNYYGWFERRERGFYALSSLGCEAIGQYADVLSQLMNESSA